MADDEIPPLPVALAVAALIIGAWLYARFVANRPAWLRSEQRPPPGYPGDVPRR